MPANVINANQVRSAQVGGLKAKAIEFVKAACARRFENPKPYTNTKTGEKKQSQLVTCNEIGSFLRQISPELFGTTEQRQAFYKEIIAAGHVNNAWAGTPALADVRYVQTSGGAKDLQALFDALVD